MNERDMKVLLFINQVEICTTRQVKETFFSGLHHSIVYNKMNSYIDSKLIKRKYMNIDTNRNSYVYYYNNPPKKRRLRHDLLITEFLAQLMQNNYEIISFKKNPTVGGIIPDAEVWIKKDNKKYGIFLEVHLSNNQFISKYYNLKEKTKREIPNILYIVTDQPLKAEKLRYFDVIIDDLKMYIKSWHCQN